MISIIMIFMLAKADDLVCLKDLQPFYVSESELERMALEKNGNVDIFTFCTKVMKGKFVVGKNECEIMAEKCYRK